MSGYETLVDLFEQTIEKYPNNRLFGEKKDGAYQWTSYQKFGEKVDQFRAALAVRGVGEGDTVAVIANNRLEWAVGAYATYGLAARYCPMYEAQMPKDWKYICEDSDAKILLVANQDIYERIYSFVDELDALEHIIYFDGDTEHEDYFGNVLEDGRANPTPAVHPDSDQLATFIYTSGTTGNPKGVRLTHANICSNINAVQERFPIGEDDVSLSFLPWAHSFGQTCELHMLFSKGAGLGIVEDVSTIIENLSEVRPTLLFSVPRIFNRIYDGVQKKIEQEGGLKKKLFYAALENSDRMREQAEKGGAGFWTKTKDSFYDSLVFSKIRDRFGGRLKYAFSGGAALSPEVARFIDNLHITVYEGYGLTETSPIVTVNSPGQRKIGSVGRPMEDVEVTIRPVEGYPEGTGEICVKGPNVMQGYHKLPDKTAEVLEDDGTFHTGDLGRIDEDGYVWILGRVKEQYKLENGKYVVPGPIEEQLKLSPFINQIMIEGTNKPHNVALIVADEETLGEWLEKHGIDKDGALEDPKVRQLFSDELKRWGNSLKGYERPGNFALIDEEFTTENDMLTPTLKLKRRIVMEKYGDLIEGLYDEAAA
jgi:long-chain acyl-CoA synthetase